MTFEAHLLSVLAVPVATRIMRLCHACGDLGRTAWQIARVEALVLDVKEPPPTQAAVGRVMRAHLRTLSYGVLPAGRQAATSTQEAA